MLLHLRTRRGLARCILDSTTREAILRYQNPVLIVIDVDTCLPLFYHLNHFQKGEGNVRVMSFSGVFLAMWRAYLSQLTARSERRVPSVIKKGHQLSTINWLWLVLKKRMRNPSRNIECTYPMQPLSIQITSHTKNVTCPHPCTQLSQPASLPTSTPSSLPQPLTSTLSATQP